MMQGIVLDASAPLYGRADELIKLLPIPIGYMSLALGIKSAREVVENYSIWGGVPRYWELVGNRSGSLFEKIDALVLDPMGPLNEEPLRLLLEEDPPAIHLRPILDAIGLGASRLSEIGSKVGQPATSLGRPIQRLLSLDLIEREVPFGAGDQHAKRTLYKIKDPFVRFWFELVAPRRSFFVQASAEQRIQLLKGLLSPLYSTTWEELCRQAVGLLEIEKGVLYGKASRYWHGQEPEWDAIAEPCTAGPLFLGEAKWIEKTASEKWILQAFNELKNKTVPSICRIPHRKIIYGLFVPEKPKKVILPKDARLFDAADLLNSLQ
jgi:AAA+ ATPase superfamily predicted ATPase